VDEKRIKYNSVKGRRQIVIIKNMNYSTSPPVLPCVSYIEAGPYHDGQRIDNFLHTYLKDVPKSHIYRILRTGEVRVNKARVKPTYRVQAGDVIRLPPLQVQARPQVPQPSAHISATLRAAILYEDNALLVLNKPAGIAVHGGSGIDLGVIESLRTLYDKNAFLELVHRLDRDTSGCLLIAKKPALLRELQALMRERAGMRKSYLALVQGRWPQTLRKIDLPLRKNTLHSGERIVRVDVEGKAAQSLFKVREYFAAASLLEVELITGRTHQIRVHASHAGHPLAGDDKYGDAAFNASMRAYGLKRLFLHAARLEIRLPGATPLIFSAPLPPILETVLTAIRG
jgi:23S rRNA pseudouridine955/2504/2580 synthase